MERKGDILYDLLDSETGQWETYEKVTTLPNGTAINDTNILPLTPIYRKLGEEYFKKTSTNNRSVSVKEFGAKGDGSSDDTAAIQKAIDFLRNSPSGPSNNASFGHGELFFPKGCYRVTSTINIPTAYGLKIKGENVYSTSIEYYSDTGVMFDIGNHLFLNCEDMFIRHVTEANRSEWNNVCFNTHGLGGGTKAYFRRVAISGFDRQFVINDIVNNDHYLFENCYFGSFNTYWYSDNPQSQINQWLRCEWFGDYINVFDISGGHGYLINGGGAIGKGTFLNLRTGVTGNWASHTAFMVNDLKMEWYGNFDPSATPKILNAESGSIANVMLNGVDMSGGLTGGFDPSNYPLFTIKGMVQVVMNQCAFANGGAIEVYRASQMAPRSPNGGEYGIIINGGTAILPDRVFVLSDAGNENNPHPAVTWENCRNVPDFALRSDRSVSTTKIKTYSTTLQHNTFPNAIKLATQEYSYIFPTYGVRTVVEKIAIRFGSVPGSNVKTFSIYSDAAKTNMIGFLSVDPLIADNTIQNVILPENTIVTEGIYIDINDPDSSVIGGNIRIDYTPIGV